MARYQVAIVRRPAGWEPKSPGDVPPGMEPPRRMLPEVESVFDAVRQALAFNEREGRESDGHWAVVIDRETAGRLLAEGRVCTPIGYKVTPIWWPEGWEPTSPYDVPNCVFKAAGGSARSAASYGEAEASVVALNRQCVDCPGSTWYVVVAVENEPVSTSVAFDAGGTETTVETRRLHVLRPEQGTRGNCDHCPAHSMTCAQADWSHQVQTVTGVESRPLRSVVGKS